jgi:hypothetical protein
VAKAADIVKRWKEDNVYPLERKGDVEKVLALYNFTINQGKGSHEIIVSHAELKLDFHTMGIGDKLALPLKSGKNIKGCYIKKLLKYIELLEEFHGYDKVK